MSAFCTSCGTAITAEFCTNCGASSPQEHVASIGAKNPPKSGSTRLVFTIVLGALFLFSTVFGFVQAGQVAQHTKAAKTAYALAESEYTSADSFDSLTAQAQASADSCYYSWFCSSDTYSSWLDLVDSDQALADEARSAGDIAFVQGDKETKAKKAAEITRTVSFVVAGLTGAGAILLLVIARRSKNKAGLADSASFNAESL